MCAADGRHARAHVDRHRRLRQDAPGGRSWRSTCCRRSPTASGSSTSPPWPTASRVVEAVAAALRVREVAGKELLDAVCDRIAPRRAPDHPRQLRARARRTAGWPTSLLGAGARSAAAGHQPRGARYRRRAAPAAPVAVGAGAAVVAGPRGRARRANRSGCSSIARSGSSRISTLTADERAGGRARSAVASTAFRSPSSWRPRGSRCSRSIRSANASTTGSAC